MVSSNYVPDRGDMVWLEFTPQAGHEQAGRRPALVLSQQNYNERSSLALFCPITSRVRGYPFEVLLPASGSIKGVVLADQIRSQDWRARHARFAVRAAPQTMAEVEGKLGALLFPSLPEATTPKNMAALLEAIDAFASMFELMFDNDWRTTQTNIGESSSLIDRKGTFLRPRVADEDNNWADRGALLGAYRHLLQCMEDCSIQRKQLS